MEPQNNQISPLLDNALKLFSERNFEGAIIEAKKYLDSSDPVLLQDTQRLLGQIQFQNEEFKEAQKYFSEVIKNNPLYTDYFNLCTSSTMNHDFSLAENSFQSAVDIAKKEKPEAVINLIFYYIKALIEVEEYNNAFDKVQLITEYYFNKNSITDYTHLVLQSGDGAISFEDLLSLVQEISFHIEKEKVNKYLSDLYEKVDLDGKKLIDEMKNLINY